MIGLCNVTVFVISDTLIYALKQRECSCEHLIRSQINPQLLRLSVNVTTGVHTFTILKVILTVYAIVSNLDFCKKMLPPLQEY